MAPAGAGQALSRCQQGALRYRGGTFPDGDGGAGDPAGMAPGGAARTGSGLLSGREQRGAGRRREAWVAVLKTPGQQYPEQPHSLRYPRGRSSILNGRGSLGSTPAGSQVNSHPKLQGLWGEQWQFLTQMAMGYPGQQDRVGVNGILCWIQRDFVLDLLGYGVASNGILWWI